MKKIFTQELGEPGSISRFDATGIHDLDTAGALFLRRLLEHYEHNGTQVVLSGLATRNLRLVSFIKKQGEDINVTVTPFSLVNWFYIVGQWFESLCYYFSDFFNFFGRMVASAFFLMRNPSLFSLRAVGELIYDILCRSMVLIGITNFLVGVILTYQLAVELSSFGVSLLSIQAAGIALLREFSPFITAIVIAARCSTGFAALIAVMKVNLEIDALKTMGRDAMCTLVIPRIVAMLIALPLLTVWADLTGMFGSMMLTHFYLGVSVSVYLQQFSAKVQLYQYLLGMQKVPFFSLLIVIVGCYYGFKTAMTSEGIGQSTIIAAVRSIFLIIIIDAFFSVLSRSMLGF